MRNEAVTLASQVQGAIVEAKTPNGARQKTENGGGGGAAAGNGLVRSGSGNAKVPLAEGAETALLYVRFRAAAEPGLKGVLHPSCPQIEHTPFVPLCL